jgi:hypothetical protein
VEEMAGSKRSQAGADIVKSYRGDDVIRELINNKYR